MRQLNQRRMKKENGVQHALTFQRARIKCSHRITCSHRFSFSAAVLPGDMDDCTSRPQEHGKTSATEPVRAVVTKCVPVRVTWAPELDRRLSDDAVGRWTKKRSGGDTRCVCSGDELVVGVERE